MASVPCHAIQAQEADALADVQDAADVTGEAMTSWEVLVNPSSACPGCVAAAGQTWPAYTTSRYCRRCLAHLRRSVQCHIWNTDRAHQVAAGKARAAQFTPASQAAAGHASFATFSARWRAEQGIAPLTAIDAQRYITPDMIRSLIGVPLSPVLQETIWRAWCAGQLLGVEAWLSDDDDPPPDPQGLWADVLDMPAEGGK